MDRRRLAARTAAVNREWGRMGRGAAKQIVTFVFRVGDCEQSVYESFDFLRQYLALGSVSRLNALQCDLLGSYKDVVRLQQMGHAEVENRSGILNVR